MEKKLSGLVLFLVLLVTYEFAMMQIEARICLAKSKKYRGRCYLRSQSRNCKTICKIKEGFTGGLCKRGVCMCSAKCGTHHLPYNAPLVSPPSEGEGGEVGQGGNSSGGDGGQSGNDDGGEGGQGGNASGGEGGQGGNASGGEGGQGGNASGGEGGQGGNASGGQVGQGGNSSGGQGGVGGRTCQSKSKKFRGKCYFSSQSRNCKTICKIKEGFTGGLCKRGICMCSAKCGTHRLTYNAAVVSPPFEVEVRKRRESGNIGGDDSGEALSLMH